MNRKYLTFVTPDGAVWGVPVSRIAQNRARHYASDFGGDAERSLNEDTLPLFEADPAAIGDWATGNMDWAHVVDVVVRMSWPPKLTTKDFVKAWLGPKKLEER